MRLGKSEDSELLCWDLLGLAACSQSRVAQEDSPSLTVSSAGGSQRSDVNSGQHDTEEDTYSAFNAGVAHSASCCKDVAPRDQHLFTLSHVSCDLGLTLPFGSRYERADLTYTSSLAESEDECLIYTSIPSSSLLDSGLAKSLSMENIKCLVNNASKYAIQPTPTCCRFVYPKSPKYKRHDQLPLQRKSSACCSFIYPLQGPVKRRRLSSYCNKSSNRSLVSPASDNKCLNQQYSGTAASSSQAALDLTQPSDVSEKEEDSQINVLDFFAKESTSAWNDLISVAGRGRSIVKRLLECGAVAKPRKERVNKKHMAVKVPVSNANEDHAGHVVSTRRESSGGSQIVDLLLICATAIENANTHEAARTLAQLQERGSLHGDSMQRLAVYFSEAIAARLSICTTRKKIPHVCPPQMDQEGLLQAFMTFNKISPMVQFAYFSANQAILDAVEQQHAVHIIDVNISQGLQWPSLIQSLAIRRRGPPNLLRITGIGSDENMLASTGALLERFAAECRVTLVFEGVLAHDDQVEEAVLQRAGLLQRRRMGSATGVTIVNCVLHLHRLLAGEGVSFRVAKLLRGLRRCGRCVVPLIETEANHNSPAFSPRFVEALHYYALLLDAMEEGARAARVSDSERLQAEKAYVATEVHNIVACEGSQRVQRHEKAATWKRHMELAGLRMLKWSWKASRQAELLADSRCWPGQGYSVSQVEDGFLALRWRGNTVVTASTWLCDPLNDPPAYRIRLVSPHASSQALAEEESKDCKQFDLKY